MTVTHSLSLHLCLTYISLFYCMSAKPGQRTVSGGRQEEITGYHIIRQCESNNEVRKQNGLQDMKNMEMLYHMEEKEVYKSFISGQKIQEKEKDNDVDHETNRDRSKIIKNLLGNFIERGKYVI